MVIIRLHPIYETLQLAKQNRYFDPFQNIISFVFSLTKIKIMRKIALSLAFAVITVAFTCAQDYKTGIGLRGGLSNGLTVKHFIKENTALEGILSTRWSGFNITGLYEINNPGAFDVNRLNWYYGAGAHIGFWDSDASWAAEDHGAYTVIGIDGILGIEYNFEAIPLNLSLDWKPAINLIGYTQSWFDEVALSLRFIF